MTPPTEWLETDGRGGFASGTSQGIRTRRYHGLLITAKPDSLERTVMVNGFDASVQTSKGHYFITQQWYAPGVIDHDSDFQIESFKSEPWPHWIFELKDGTRIEHEIFISREKQLVCISWRLLSSEKSALLFMRPFLSGRNYHSLHEENPLFNFDSTISQKIVRWQPYGTLPPIYSFANGDYSQDAIWYRHFLYQQEQERGLDAREDLASPGFYRWNLSEHKAAWLLSASHLTDLDSSPEKVLDECVQSETRRRQKFTTRISRSADQYQISLTNRKTIVAGYPWFTDWGRDTFVSVRGLCLGTGQFEQAHEIITEWSKHISSGMLPNFFPEGNKGPEYNSVDASLWLIIVIYDFLQKTQKHNTPLFHSTKTSYYQIIDEVLSSYARGTRYSISLDDDGLLRCGERGVQLTWMDAKTGDDVVTPRVGKPIEVQALWLNALRISEIYTDQWRPIFAKGLESFLTRFWIQDKGHLFDVIDCDHIANANDATLRPNQIFAVGGLPFSFFENEKIKSVLTVIEQHLLTPLGLRTLAPYEPNYAAAYIGNPEQRDKAYHQGTVWPWLMGPFVEAWLRARNFSEPSKKEARIRFVEPLMLYLDSYGLGHLPEIADAEPPHQPRGCPFQAWSQAELLRMLDMVNPPS